MTVSYTTRGAQVIRVIHAADNETIEVHWRRARRPGSALGDELILRYTAPPTAVWDAHLTTDPDPAQDPLPFEQESESHD